MAFVITGTGAQEILAPDIGLLLASEVESWPDVLRQDRSLAAIRQLRSRFPIPKPTGAEDAVGLFAERALRAAMRWRIDLYIKLVLHIGWQWRTATRIIEETVEASKQQRLETAIFLAREQFKDRAARAASTSHPDAEQQPRSAVLQANDEQLTAAFISLYEKSRAFHFRRLARAQAWWGQWGNEARILQWQAHLLTTWDRVGYYVAIGNDDGVLYEVLDMLARLCQSTELYETMQRDEARVDEILAPDISLWTPALITPVRAFFNKLLNSPAMQDRHESIRYWMDHGNLPAEITGEVSPIPLSISEDLHHQDGNVRCQAVRTLGTLRALEPSIAAQVLPLLAARLGDTDLVVRQAVVEALGGLGPSVAPQALPLLAAWLGDQHWGARRAAVQALGGLGSSMAVQVLPLLAARLGDTDSIVRQAAVQALGVLGPSVAAQALPLLEKASADSDPSVRQAAVEALGGLGSSMAVQVLPLLAARLGDTDSNVRWAAVRALRALGPSVAPQALPLLAARLGDTDSNVRQAAVQALGGLGPNMAPQALPLLERAVEDTDSNVRQAAVQALGVLGPSVAAQALPLLEKASADSNWNVRQAAVEALQALRPDNM